jgi:hypothetical protein
MRRPFRRLERGASRIPGAVRGPCQGVPDPVAVDHLRRTWVPPLSGRPRTYLAASQVVTLAVAVELNWRCAGWQALTTLQTAANVVHTLTTTLKHGALAQKAPDSERLQAVLQDHATWQQALHEGHATIGREIASWRAAFADWAAAVGTTPTALWAAWAPGVVHPAVPDAPDPALTAVYRAALDAIWDRHHRWF